MKYTITMLSEEDHELYAQFVSSCPDALYEHSLAVKDLVQRYFKFEPRYIVAKNSVGQIVGALPLFKAKSFVEGTRLVSIPFFPYGGVIGESDECKRLLLEEAKKLSSTSKFLEMRQHGELSAEVARGFVRQAPIINFYLDLKESEEEMLQSLHKSVRYDIRKAQKNNLQFSMGDTTKLLNDFYDVYLNTRKRRGVPAWPMGLFKEALKTCDTKVAVTYHEGKPIAGCFLFFDKKTIEYAFAGTDYRHSALCPYYLLLWEIICYGIKQGYTVLELGGTTKVMNEGNMYSFKKRWSTKTEEIPYYFYAREEKNIPVLQNSFKVYTLYGKVWSLLPKWLIKKISPPIIRQFS